MLNSEVATEQSRLGRRVLPVKFTIDGKRTAKIPAIKNWLTLASTTPPDAWWRDPETRVGVVVPDGIVIIDTVPSTEKIFPPNLPRTHTVRTPNGLHLYYTVPGPGTILPGIENVDCGRYAGKNFVVAPGNDGYVVMDRRDPVPFPVELWRDSSASSPPVRVPQSWEMEEAVEHWCELLSPYGWTYNPVTSYFVAPGSTAGRSAQLTSFGNLYIYGSTGIAPLESNTSYTHAWAHHILSTGGAPSPCPNFSKRKQKRSCGLWSCPSCRKTLWDRLTSRTTADGELVGNFRRCLGVLTRAEFQAHKKAALEATIANVNTPLSFIYRDRGKEGGTLGAHLCHSSAAETRRGSSPPAMLVIQLAPQNSHGVRYQIMVAGDGPPLKMPGNLKRADVIGATEPATAPFTALASTYSDADARSNVTGPECTDCGWHLDDCTCGGRPAPANVEARLAAARRLPALPPAHREPAITLPAGLLPPASSPPVLAPRASRASKVGRCGCSTTCASIAAGASMCAAVAEFIANPSAAAAAVYPTPDFPAPPAPIVWETPLLDHGPPCDRADCTPPCDQVRCTWSAPSPPPVPKPVRQSATNRYHQLASRQSRTRARNQMNAAADRTSRRINPGCPVCGRPLPCKEHTQ